MTGSRADDPPKLLSGGNPQIPEGDGDGPVQLQFLRGTSLDPVPPKASKHPELRYLDIHEDDELDDVLLTSWIRQASELPGEAV